jgi:hypothetical protein
MSAVTNWRYLSTSVRVASSSVLFATAVAVAALSLRALALFALNADVYDLATSIEKGTSPDAKYLAAFVSRAGLDRASSNCDNNFTRASLTVNLAALDTATAESNAPLTSAALENAIDSAARRLACNPLDGNAWLRYAAAANRAKGSTPAVVDALRLSYWTTPSEAWILSARLEFATRLYLAGVTGFEAEYLADLRRFASFAGVDQVAAAYVDLAPPVRAQMRPLIETQPEFRRKAIVAEIDRLGVDFTQESTR